MKKLGAEIYGVSRLSGSYLVIFVTKTVATGHRLAKFKILKNVRGELPLDIDVGMKYSIRLSSLSVAFICKLTEEEGEVK